VNDRADVPTAFNIASWFLDRNDDRRTALLTNHGPVSYGEVKEAANRVGNVLRQLGVRQGDRVLLALGDGVEFVATWFGAQKIGAVTAEVYTFLQAKDYRYYLDYAEPAVVVADQVTVGRLRAAGARHLLVLGGEPDELRAGEHHFQSLVDAQPATLEPAATRSDDVAIWRFTTGSTGSPKACLIAARSPLLSFRWYAEGIMDIRPDDVVLPVPKLFFGYANNMAVAFPFAAGASSVVFAERSTPERVFELIALHRPTILVNVPTMMSAMLSHPDAARQDLSSVRLCVSGGEVLPVDLHHRFMDTFGVDTIDGIGSSESFHGYVSNRPGRSRPGSLGQVIPGYRVRVVDDAGNSLPDGEAGRLEVTGETVALGYWRAPAKTAEAFPAEHTVRTNDLVRRDADGFFYYEGRADDLLKVGGIWVVPTEVERCLLTHPVVLQCGVVGQQVDGLTRTCAFVVTSGEVTGTALQDYVRSRLSPHKYPREVHFVDELPLTASGKIDRRALREDSVYRDAA
jgi:benzoate-CoA ligase family protein